MLVSLKTLQDDIFTVEIDPSETVKCFKEKIEKEKGDKFPAKSMRLMYAGKFLVDNKKVSDYNVEEKKFVIVVIKKPKATIKKEPNAEPESSSEVDDSSDTGNEERTTTADETLIGYITELGFSRNDVIAALVASYNNPDRAVEYLINGAFPSSSREDAEAEARRRNPDHTTDPAAAHLLRSLSSSGSAAAGRASRGSGHMPSPERIMQIFSEAIDESNAQTRAADRELERDQDLITQSFEAMEEAEASATASSGRSDSNRPRTGYGMGAGQYPPPMPDSSMFSNERMFDSFSNEFMSDMAGIGFPGSLMDRDHDAIERLKQLGFSDQKAIEAYFVCERNENAAADYLFSQNFD